MIIDVTKIPVSSTASVGGILKGLGNSIVSHIPTALFDLNGLLVITGVGIVTGGSNPSNTIPDELTVIFQNPNTSIDSSILFSKIFTNSLNAFEFEIKITGRSSGSSDIYVKILNQDGTSSIQFMTFAFSINTFYNIYFNHTSHSGLYGITIDSVCTEYKSFK